MLFTNLRLRFFCDSSSESSADESLSLLEAFFRFLFLECCSSESLSEPLSDSPVLRRFRLLDFFLLEPRLRFFELERSSSDSELDPVSGFRLLALNPGI